MKKFLKWGVGLVVIGFVGLAGVGKAVALHEDYQLFRTNLDELQGVKIGETQEEILYELGNPFMVQKADVDAEKPDAAGFRIVEPDGSLRDGKNFRDYPIWEWSAQDGTVSVAAKFDPETKKVIRVNCRAGTDASATQLVCITVSMVGLGTDNNRINPFYRRSEDYIVEHLGKPDQEIYSTVGSVNRKILIYDELGLQFVMIGQEAANIYKYETNPSFTWWLLHGPKQPVI